MNSTMISYDTWMNGQIDFFSMNLLFLLRFSMCSMKMKWVHTNNNNNPSLFCNFILHFYLMSRPFDTTVNRRVESKSNLQFTWITQYRFCTHQMSFVHWFGFPFPILEERNWKPNHKVWERNDFFFHFSRSGFNLSFVQLVMNVDAVLPESVPCWTHTHTYVHTHPYTHSLFHRNVNLLPLSNQIRYSIYTHTHAHTDYIVYVCQDAYYTIIWMWQLQAYDTYTYGGDDVSQYRVGFLSLFDSRVCGSVLRYTIQYKHSVNFQSFNARKKILPFQGVEIFKSIFWSWIFIFQFISLKWIACRYWHFLQFTSE